MEIINGGKHDRDTMDCVEDPYSKHGWSSVALTAMFIAVPWGWAGYHNFSMCR